MKQSRCPNCKEKESINEEKIKVMHKGEVREWCITCYEGFKLFKEEKENEKSN